MQHEGVGIEPELGDEERHALGHQPGDEATSRESRSSLATMIRAIEAAGIVSLLGIAAALDARGIPSARGGRWQVSNVRNVLRRQVAG